MSTSILATFVTMKNLYDAQKHIDPYAILREFVIDVINTRDLHTFSPANMQDYLKDYFGFDVPESVVRTVVKKTNGIELKNDTAIVDKKAVCINPTFKEQRSLAEEEYQFMLKALLEFASQTEGIKDIKEEMLSRELISFLLEDDFKRNDISYRNIVARFVLEHEHDEKISRVLSSICEGSILYIGLNNNIAETGSLKHHLTLFLDTEVLFNLCGLNGGIHQHLTEELMDQIKLANTPEQKIKLCYFAEVEDEINRYFSSAENIVEGLPGYTLDKPAMKNIVNGCSSISDVASKRSDFFHTLRAKYGIVPDERRNYYNSKDSEFNLEDANIEDAKFEDIKQISHINVLRHGGHSEFVLDSKYAIVTNTRSLLQASRDQVLESRNDGTANKACDFAISVNTLTNILWYKLGGSFGCRTFPSNVDAVYKTRIVLSASIAQNVKREFENAKKQYLDGELTDSQLASRILALKEKPITPDDILQDSIDEDLDFSPDFLARYEREREANKKAVADKERELQRIRQETRKISRDRETELAAKDSLLKASEDERSALQAELKQYKEREKVKEDKRDRRNKIFKFIWRIVWKSAASAIVAIMVIAIIWFFSPNENITLSVAIGIASGLITLVAAARSIIKKDYQNIFEKSQEQRTRQGRLKL